MEVNPHPRPLTLADESEGEGQIERAAEPLSDSKLEEWLRIPTDRRMLALIEAFRRNWDIERVHEVTGGITRWFLHRFQSLASNEMEIMSHGGSPSDVSKRIFVDGKVQE